MTEFYINKRTKEVSTDDRYYGQPGWLVCTEEEYKKAETAARIAALEDDKRKLIEALEKISSFRSGGVVSASFADIADEVLAEVTK